MEKFNFNYGYYYFNVITHNDIIPEFEIGIEDKFGFAYYHDWIRGQVHFLSLGVFYIYWRGAPLIDKIVLGR
jgi:hypothetical protein